MTTYRFGALEFTLEQIRDTGLGHGAGLIVYYPPQCWGGPTARWTRTDLRPATPLEAAYRAGYVEGYYRLRPHEDRRPPPPLPPSPRLTDACRAAALRLQVTCGRSACDADRLTHYNTGTDRYYCAGCARRINEANPGLCVLRPDLATPRR